MIKEKAVIVMSSRFSIFALAFFILISIISYIYLANSAVKSLSLLEKAEKDFESISVDVSEMESKKLFLENGINTDLAANLGLVEVSEKLFIIGKQSKTAYNF